MGYWGIRGLAAPIRMMLMHKRIPFRNVCYDLEVKPEGGFSTTWFSQDKPGLKAKNPLVNLPYIIDGDLIISQSVACLAHLGKKYGLWGATEAEDIICQELLCEIFDLRNKMTGFCYSGAEAPTVEAAAKKLLGEVTGANGILQKLELVLGNNKVGKGCFLVTDHATAPDFHLFEMLDQYTLLAKHYPIAPTPDDSSSSPFLSPSFPHLATFHEKFAALPENAAYLSSPLHTKMPMNSLSAVFGSLPGGGRYAPGATIDWHGLTGNC